MKISYKVVTEFCQQKRLENKEVWLEPNNIVSIQQKRNHQLSMNYIQVVDCNKQVYNVYDPTCQNQLLDYQEQKENPYKKLKENLTELSVITAFVCMIAAGGAYFGMEYAQENAPLATPVAEVQ